MGFVIGLIVGIIITTVIDAYHCDNCIDNWRETNVNSTDIKNNSCISRNH